MVNGTERRDDDAMERAVERFFPDAVAVEPVGGRAHLVRVETAHGVWRVRQWPAETTRQRVEFTARLRHALHAGVPELTAAPALTAEGSRPIIEIAGRYYDADTWLPGQPSMRRSEVLDRRGHGLLLPGAFPSVAGLEPAASAIARWHLAAEPVAKLPDPPVANTRAVLDAVQVQWRIDRDRLRPLTAEQPWAQRWLRYGEQVLARAEEALLTVGFFLETPPVVAHLALWPSHLLYSGTRLTGILDPTRAALATPLLDIASLITRFGAWSAERAELALGAYSEVRRLTPDERRMLPVIAGIDLVAESARILWHAFGSEHDRGSAAAERSRVGAEQLVRSLEALAPAVLRAGDVVDQPKRRWDRRGPRPERAVKERGDTRPDWKKRGETRPPRSGGER